MGTAITDVKFHLYRADINEIMQTETELIFDKEENGIYTFTTTFTPTQNSSFGLDENAFRVSVWAKDKAGNEDTVKDGQLPEGANSSDFSMKVRVKEKSNPHIQTDGEKWGSHHTSSSFEAHFLAWDQNNDYRLAGIDISRLEVRVNGELQTLGQSAASYFGKETLSINPNKDKENGQGYRIVYPLENLIDGEYEIKVTIWDNDGNPQEATGVISIDTAAPVVTLRSPEDNAILDTKEFIVDGYVDTLSIVYVNIYKDEQLLITDTFKITSLDNNSFYKKYDSSILDDGIYRIEVYAKDSNIETSISNTIIRNLIIDSNAPKFTSIKFYSMDTNELVTELEYNKQYKIVVTVE